MAIDGVPQEVTIYDDGYEAGPGTWAEIERPSRGTRCGWSRSRISSAVTPSRPAEFARSQLGIHAQTFWANNVVPRVEARLVLHGSGFTAADFEPNGAISGQCVLDLQQEGQTLVWKVRSYRRWGGTARRPIGSCARRGLRQRGPRTRLRPTLRAAAADLT
jgi:hypothetical protein